MNEAEDELPAYEVDMLVRQYVRHAGGSVDGDDDVADPFAAVPTDLEELI